jgi:hypothetical protein
MHESKVRTIGDVQPAGCELTWQQMHTVRTSRPFGAAADGTVQIRCTASTGSSKTRPPTNGDKTRPHGDKSMRSVNDLTNETLPVVLSTVVIICTTGYNIQISAFYP